jgi:exonuclease SbcC
MALAAPPEEEVQAVSAAQPLRAVRDAATKAAAAQSKAKADLDEIGRKFQEATRDLEIAGQALGKAESELKMAREQEATLHPEIEKAKHLDAQIDPARRTAETARAECERLRGLMDQGRRELEDLATRTVECEAERCGSEQWLATHVAESQLSGQWPRWQAELRKHAALGKELGTIATRLVTAQGAAAVVMRERGKAADLESEAERSFQAAQTHWDKVAAALEGRDLAALSARTSGFRHDLEKLEALAVIVERARSAQDAISTARAQAIEFRAAEERSRLDAERLAGELEGCRLRTDEARFALETARSALSFDEQRAFLQDGQACPLCGSPDHPYVHGSLSSATIGVLEDRVRELERLGRDLQASCSAAEATQAVARTNAASAETAANDSIAEAERAQHEYRAQVASLALDLPALAAEASATIETKIEQAQERLDQAESDEQSALDLATKRDRARDELDQARSKRNAAVETHARHLKQEQELAGAIGRFVEEQTRLAAERDSIEALLTPVMAWHPNWVGAARQESQVFLEDCDGRVQEFEACQRRLAAAAETLATLRAGHETGVALLAERQTHFEKSATNLKDHEEALTALEEQRSALLHGRGVLEVEFEVSKLVEDATTSHESARNAHAGAGTSLALAQAAREEASKRQREVDQEATHAELALDVGLARLGIGREKLEERLAHDETWIAKRRKDLDALRESVTRERATRDERQRSLDDHSANGRPEGDQDVARARVASARAQVEDLAQTLIGHTAKQKQDDDQRLGRSSVLAEVHAQEESSRVWEQLDEVIGSADGKKFRVFAQSLAFEALLREANAHLADLAPRYRLLSVPGAALELQVADQDLGSEVRTINGLSGGEIFLVSLALALGLSGISTRATQAQTLFIDEGFGTLDRDTLDHAMVALENLQATGRTVGIISHVPELQERFGAQVRVERTGCGKSRVVVVGP